MRLAWMAGCCGRWFEPTGRSSCEVHSRSTMLASVTGQGRLAVDHGGEGGHGGWLAAAAVVSG